MSKKKGCLFIVIGFVAIGAISSMFGKNDDQNASNEGSIPKTSQESKQPEASSSSTSSSKKAVEKKSSFVAKDVKDATIESIKTYSDYIDMYNAIIQDYYNNYQKALKGTILWDEQTFKKLKEDTDKELEKQKKEYGPMKNMPIVGKDSLVSFLKDYRDTLKETTDSLKASLG